MSKCNLLLIVALVGCSQQTPHTDDNRDGLFREALPVTSQAKEHWEIANKPREFSFPADHGAHEDFRIEWWYYTGNLQASDGRRIGYQLTFFRTGIHKQPVNPSKWTVRDLYTAHFAVSDVTNRKHYCFQQNSRAGINQAGADSDRYRVWNGNWSVEQDGTDHILKARENNVAIELRLEQTRPPILHGEQGLSQKGETVGNASYYYSFTRMPTVGRVTIGDEEFEISGDSWMDHEFSTSFLEPNQIGWDWMSIQLASGKEIMLYRMRRSDNEKDPYSAGTLVDGDSVTQVAGAEYTMTPQEFWTSPDTGARYPLRWRVTLPKLGYEFDVTPSFDAQEMTTADTTGISYWEGAIDVRGQGPEGEVRGQGYMELTGYVGQGLGTLFSQ